MSQGQVQMLGFPANSGTQLALLLNEKSGRTEFLLKLNLLSLIT